MHFAERNGFAPIKSIQVDSIDFGLRNRLYNLIHTYCAPSPFINKELSFVVDKLGCCDRQSDIGNWQLLDALLLRAEANIPWYMPYEIIELFFDAKRCHCKYCRGSCPAVCDSCTETLWLNNIPQILNKILEEENSAYRFINDQFVNIVNTTELEAISQAFNSPYNSVNIHIKKALSLYSDRKNPDYENSIKESISAVEAICCTITGMSGASATLGAALKKLEDNGVIIHSALRDAFLKIYGYTSDSDGIRHGGINFKNAPSEDAKYMLVSCSAFVNYLIEKYGKIGG